jgi:hypothetical protein
MTPEQSGSVDRAIDRFWDEIALGGAGDPTGVDPVDVTAIRSLHSRNDLPDPTPAFAKRLRAELMHGHAHVASSKPDPVILPNGRFVPPPRPIEMRRSRKGRGHPRGFFPLVAAILLILAGAGAGYRALGPESDDGRTTIPAVIVPTSTPTPVATPTLVATVTPTVVQIDLPGGMLLPKSFGATFDHRTMPPQSEATTQEDGDFLLRYVVSGHVSVRSESPMRRLRAEEDGRWEEITPGSEVSLGPGDAFVFNGGSPVTFVNSSAEPVEFIAWNMSAGGGGNSVAPNGWKLHANHAVNLAVVDHTNAAVRVQLRQVELTPGEELAPPAGALLYQSVNLTENAAGETVAAFLGQLPGGGLRNAGRQALTIFELIVEMPDAAGGTAASGSPTT